MSQHDFTGARWIKSSRSGGQNECVELAHAGNVVGIRDSKNGDTGPVLRFNAATLTTFLTASSTGSVSVRR